MTFVPHGIKAMTNTQIQNTAPVLEKAGDRSVEHFATAKPMAQLFENIFDKGAKCLIPEAVTAPVLNCTESRYVPPVHASYHFRKDLLRSILAFLRNPHGDALFLTGPTGSGKTSLITEIFGRLNWPLQVFTCTETFEFSQLRGSWVYKTQPGSTAPSMVFQHGPLLTAMKEGQGILINEADIAPAGEMSGLNDIIEGRPITVPETNEVIKPHPLFRLIVTANSKGQGDESGAYAGIQQQNIAALDRYRFLEVGYPDAEVEINLLTGIFAPSLGSEARRIAEKFVQLANKVRELFVGDNNGTVESTVAVPMSTRTLTRWAYLTQDYCGRPRDALNEALLNRCTAADKEAINNLAVTIFGAQWDAS